MRSWSKRKDRGEHYIRLDAWTVVVGEHSGSGHTDFGGSCTHAEFLAGRYQDIGARDHGKRTLQEVIAAIRGAHADPTLQRERQRAEALLQAWDELPVDRTLLQAVEDPDDRGMDHYHKASDAIAVRWAGYVWEQHRQAIRITDDSGAVTYDSAERNPRLQLGNNIRISGVRRCGARIFFRYSNYFLRDVPEIMAELGRDGWLEVCATGIISRCKAR